tara:strand:+ start:357 stop:665 length:309 start_codon:yes stop_codon:yes gene_type:complete
MGGNSVTKPDPSVFCGATNAIRSTILRKFNAKFCCIYGTATEPRRRKGNRLTLTDLQTDDSGLEVGALFQQDGFVKITRTNVPHVRGFSATGSVGTVTVTTT